MRVAAIIPSVEIPGLQSYLFRQTYQDLKDNHVTAPGGFLDMLDPWIQAGWVKYNQQDLEFKFWNKSIIHLRYAESMEKVRIKYKGPEFHQLFFDEATNVERGVYTWLRGRLRLPDSMQLPPHWVGRLPRAILGTNPGGPGHNWFKADFYDNAPPMQIVRMPKEEGGMLRQFIPAFLEDNPSLNVADYEGNLLGIGDPELARAMRYGDWNIVAGGMFDDVWRDEIHVLPCFDIPAGWRIDRAFDWGSSKPYAVGWFAEANGDSVQINGKTRHFHRGTVIQIGELYGWNGKPNEGQRLTAPEIARKIIQAEKDMGLHGRVQIGPADSAMFTVENGNDIAGDFARAGVRWEPCSKGADSRVNGWEALRKRLKASMASPMEDPGFFITESCIHTRRTLPVLPRDKRKRDDVDTEAEDHVADMIRYRLATQRKTITVGNFGWKS